MSHEPATAIRPMSSVGAAVRSRKTQVVADALHRVEHVEEIARDGDLLHRVGQLAVLDPEARGAARVVPGDPVDPRSRSAR